MNTSPLSEIPKAIWNAGKQGAALAQRQMNDGVNPALAVGQGLAYGTGKMTGVSQIVEAVVGENLVTSEKIGTKDRIMGGLEGVLQAGLTLASGKVGKNGSTPGGQTAKGISAEAKYAQTTYSNNFSQAGQNFYSQLAGKQIKSIDDLVNAIKSGAIKVSDIPVEFVMKGDNQIIANTRTAKALEKAEIPRSEWNAVDKTKDAATNKRVNDQLQRNDLGPEGTAATVPKEKIKEKKE